MTIKLFLIGKTETAYLEEGISIYLKRLQHYCKVEVIVLELAKNMRNKDAKILMQAEGDLIRKQLQPGDVLILLDEKGKSYDSVNFAQLLQKQMNSGIKNLVFAVGGPFGFSPEIYALANGELSLSKMTFTHEMVRLFAIEQIYRAFTIIKGEKYHHN